MIVTKHLRIHGQVQGVGFRAAMYREALRLNVTGWVRNRSGGAVEAVFQGSEQSVAAMLAWAHRGPPGARVEHVEVKPAVGVFSDFDLLSSV